tara:strand:- start:184 stop:408 length:225 start_codon:yes stop_codon:yes gene_type:complete
MNILQKTKSMKFLILIPLIFTNFVPAFADGHKSYKKEEFEKIKLMKIEYLNKRINCVKASNNLKEMKSCWRKKK